MQHETLLNDFLKNNININQTRLDTAQTAHNALQEFLNNSNISDKISKFYTQWSYSHQTIIKPQWENWKYDVDLAIEMKYDEEYKGEEKKYHEIIIDVLEGSDKYESKLDLTKERAIRINYDANDEEFHIDLVPIFEDKEDAKKKIINRKDNETETSGGKEFRDWVSEKNSTSNMYLKRVIRILKFFRDNSWFDLKSVQLTLLASLQIDKLEDDDLSNLTKSLYNISSKLNKYLQDTDKLEDLNLSNPALPEEKFERNITQSSYSIFRDSFNLFFNDLENAYNEEDEERSKELWNCLFGSWFDVTSSDKTLSLSYDHAWKIDSQWRNYNNKVNLINISCFYQEAILKEQWRSTIYSNWQSYPYNWPYLKEGSKLHFFARLPENLNWAKVVWQVTNSPISDEKRGEIDNAKNPLWYIKWNWRWIEETTAYNWKHWVKCFLVKNNIIIGESKKFYINIYTNHDKTSGKLLKN